MVGASGLLLSVITAFYDIQRARHPEGFFRYPDYFLFHVARIRGNHMMLDVIPDHKEVVVADDPEVVCGRSMTVAPLISSSPKVRQVRPTSGLRP